MCFRSLLFFSGPLALQLLVVNTADEVDVRYQAIDKWAGQLEARIAPPSLSPCPRPLIRAWVTSIATVITTTGVAVGTTGNPSVCLLQASICSNLLTPPSILFLAPQILMKAVSTKLA